MIHVVNLIWKRMKLGREGQIISIFSTMRILFNYLICMKIYVDFKIIKTF